MKIAITGGSGFVGHHLAESLLAGGHSVILISRHPRKAVSERVTPVANDLSDVDSLTAAFCGCEAVAHCAGINRELGLETFQRVHIDATRNVVAASNRAGVKRIALMSFLRARPNCGSRYHESKWAAEEVVRASGLDYTILKAGMVYGLGDHMLSHLSRSLHSLPLFLKVGLREKPIRPLAIEDLVRVLRGALVEARLPGKTVSVTGAEQLYLSEAARRVGQVIGRKVFIFPAPILFHKILGQMCEWTMKVPLVAKAQVRILSEGVVEAAGPVDPLPPELLPSRHFTADQILRGLPEAGPFGLRDLKCCASTDAE